MSANDTAPVTNTAPDQAFFEGVVDRGSQKKVAIAVNVNFELKDGSKERGHAMPIHVIPLLRRAHPDGVVKVISQWSRGIPRTKELTQGELKTELENLTRSFGGKLPGQAASILAEVYGATEVEQLNNLHAKMREVFHAWVKLERIGRDRLKQKYPKQAFSELAVHGMLSEVITDEELNGLVTLIEPERRELDSIELPELGGVDNASNTGGDEDAGDAQGANDEGEAIDWLTSELETQVKMSQQDALALTAAVIERDGKEPDDDLLVRFKTLQKGDGTLHQNKRAQVLRLLAQFREKLKSVPAT